MNDRIKIQVPLVEHIMRNFEPVMKRPSSVQTLVKLCSVLGVKLDDLTDVGSFYLRSKHPDDRLLGQNLLLCASRAGSLSATIFLVFSARNQDSLNAGRFSEPRTHLKSSVQAGTTNIQAWVLQGKLYQDQERYKEAASCFEKAISLANQCKDADDTWMVKFLRWIGFDVGIKDPNLETRPQDVALDHVEAYIQLATLQNNHKIDGDGKKTMKVAALKYDDPKAYFSLAGYQTEKYSYEWLQYMLKAAASGYGSAMEEIADLLSRSEEELEEMVSNQRVRDWVLQSPVYWPMFAESFGPSSPLETSEGGEKRRTLERYRWALAWLTAASERAHENNGFENYLFATLQWKLGELTQELKLPLRSVREWLVNGLSHARTLEKSRKVDQELRKWSEIDFREMQKHSMYQEAAEILDYWISEGSMDISWLRVFLEAIENVPAGTWRSDKKRRRKVF
ncbi:Structure-specific endonuclease subunit SLX1 [Venturia nashicola]|uniref:Structure-specific endonuclease subunit SLX1 n=1 Tax=Venturia nashicola TaxID=86259 RepID=A0A4Z1NQC2_9PEZI|nr:Structure-specific endonuclease subunit SLX1 [Venturia nashicola]